MPLFRPQVYHCPECGGSEFTETTVVRLPQNVQMRPVEQQNRPLPSEVVRYVYKCIQCGKEQDL